MMPQIDMRWMQVHSLILCFSIPMLGVMTPPFSVSTFAVSFEP
jgi:hypothetical protein